MKNNKESQSNDFYKDETLLRMHNLSPCYIRLERQDLEKLKAILEEENNESIDTPRASSRNSNPDLDHRRSTRSDARFSESSGRRSRQYICYVCLEKFTNDYELQVHKAVHDSEENLEQAIKPVAEASLEIINVDQNNSDSISFENTVSIDVDQVHSEASKDSYVFKCLTCSCYFKTGLNLFIHVRENKGKACKFYCDECNKIFKYPVEFSQHISKHLGSLGKRKKRQDTKTDNKIDKLDYKIDAIGDRPIPNSSNKNVGRYVCVLCSKSFEDCFQLKRHLILGHKVQETEIEVMLNEQVNKKATSAAVDTLNKNRVNSIEPSTDDQVNKNATSVAVDTLINNNKVNSIQPSIDRLDSESTNIDSTTDGKLTCNLCFDEFSTKNDLEDHISLHLEISGSSDRNNTKQVSNESINNPNDVIVIDDDEDTSSKQTLTTATRETKTLEQTKKSKSLLGKLPTPRTSSLLKKSTPAKKPLILSKSGLKLMKTYEAKNTSNLQQPPKMILLSGLTSLQTTSQNPKNLKLLKTGPQSFQLCFDTAFDSSQQSGTDNSNVSNINVANVQKTQHISHLPVIHLQPEQSNNPPPLLPVNMPSKQGTRIFRRSKSIIVPKKVSVSSNSNIPTQSSVVTSNIISAPLPANQSTSLITPNIIPLASKTTVPLQPSSVITSNMISVPLSSSQSTSLVTPNVMSIVSTTTAPLQSSSVITSNMISVPFSSSQSPSLVAPNILSLASTTTDPIQPSLVVSNPMSSASTVTIPLQHSVTTQGLLPLCSNTNFVDTSTSFTHDIIPTSLCSNFSMQPSLIATSIGSSYSSFSSSINAVTTSTDNMKSTNIPSQSTVVAEPSFSFVTTTATTSPISTNMIPVTNKVTTTDVTRSLPTNPESSKSSATQNEEPKSTIQNRDHDRISRNTNSVNGNISSCPQKVSIDATTGDHDDNKEKPNTNNELATNSNVSLSNKVTSNQATEKDNVTLPETNSNSINSIMKISDVRTITTDTCELITEVGDESDDQGLVIDEGINDGVSVTSENTEAPPSIHIPAEKPKIFVRKLCDLMDPEKLDVDEKKKKQMEKKCTDCNLVFVKARAFRTHLRKKKSCIRCDYQNCKINVMKVHYQTKHDLYLCVKCKLIAENGYDLYKHNAEKHICSICQHPMFDFESHRSKCPGPKKK